ncbi:hypothetical protein J4E89_002259 [Alternaria sp. Ai002NY15]|nr:hypothetical protein J4E89_002259 [Alternaria sp. Ai002NY15]
MPPPKTIFTSYERNALKDRWGSQATRLTRDSFLPFGSCQLCLLPSVDPVCCSQGDLFCRECAMTNLLAQRKEMKRLEKLNERQKLEDEDQKLREEEEARLLAVEEFEAVQMGLSVKAGASARVVGRQGSKIMVEEEQDAKAGEARGTKRKFEIDQEELKRIAQEEQSKAKRTFDAERKAAKGHLPSFWVPGETPDQHHKSAEKAKQTPVCPSSHPDQPHSLSLKSLTSVNFHEEKSSETGKSARTCPSCQKALSNSTKAILAIPCGHVLCKPCVDKFLRPEHRHQRDAHDQGPEPETVHCYVCDADLTTVPDAKEGKKKKKDNEKEKAPKPGLVEIRSEDYPADIANDLKDFDLPQRIKEEVYACAWEYARCVIPQYTNWNRYVAFMRVIVIGIVAECKGDLVQVSLGDNLLGYNLTALLDELFQGTTEQ